MYVFLSEIDFKILLYIFLSIIYFLYQRNKVKRETEKKLNSNIATEEKIDQTTASDQVWNIQDFKEIPKKDDNNFKKNNHKNVSFIQLDKKALKKSALYNHNYSKKYSNIDKIIYKYNGLKKIVVIDAILKKKHDLDTFS